MTQLHFNLDMDFLKDSILNSNLDHVVKSTVVLVLNEYMKKERDEYLNTDAYERTDERFDYRNGYYDREYMLSIGKVKLRVPRTRSGEFSPTVFEKYRRCDQAFALSMLEMVINGVSTRKVKNVVEQLCGEYVSKSFVSSLTEKLDPIVNEWANRPLNTEYYRYVYVDAMYIKVREHHKVVSKAVYIATGLNEGNRRDIIGLRVSHEESYEAWHEFLNELITRGLQSPQLVISDAHSGLKKAIQKVFIGTSWQRCTVHFKKNLIEKLPRKGMNDVKEELKRIFDAETPQDARKRKDEFVSNHQDNPKLEKVINNLEEGFDDAIQYLNEPLKYHRFIRSTNSLERLNQEVRRRERVIRIFPNTQSAFRLIGAVLMDYEEEEQRKRPILRRDKQE
ncbi:IS256 family transposase [Virgibacillus halodenitrificans]|uniref:IS256 family transposase n=1 Tax=Virgibacillus halodenitrificans TaxID=1482 RepID=UPI00045CD1DC|nr:IS256 family transposase [Virgibacillus halodenitrificans]CDQ37199.1 Transposase [Virgibacillus halodenitrificans]CDQ37334.1 Transposase [Virgibacillus halodenitrificans]CDQ37367.1 Transposase [Virgibacillus halodenitrificans]